MILVTGHEPPPGFDADPSGQLARRLDGESVAGHAIAGAVLPADPGRAADGVAAALDAHEPDVHVAAGFDPETTAVLVARMAFAAGDWLGLGDDEGAVAEPVGHLATLPAGAVVDALRDRGIPARRSTVGATSLSDRVLYAARDHVDGAGLATTVGAVTLPCTPTQAVRCASAGVGEHVPPSLAPETAAEALLAAAHAGLG